MIHNDSLLRYLQLHNRLPIPGLGTLRIERRPAQKDTASRQLHPPVFQYRFDPETDVPGQDFFPFLARQEKISEAAALEAFQEWSSRFCRCLNDERAVSLGTVGAFRKDALGETVFEGAETIPVFYSAVPAERISTPQRAMEGFSDEFGSEQAASLPLEYPDEPVRDKWLAYALLLMVLLMALLGYHYYQNGFVWDEFGLRTLPGF